MTDCSLAYSLRTLICSPVITVLSLPESLTNSAGPSNTRFSSFAVQIERAGLPTLISAAPHRSSCGEPGRASASIVISSAPAVGTVPDQQHVLACRPVRGQRRGLPGAGAGTVASSSSPLSHSVTDRHQLWHLSSGSLVEHRRQHVRLTNPPSGSYKA